jgi:hypothetical protein
MGINLLAGQTNSEGLVAMTAREFMFGYQSALVTLGNKFMPSWIKFDKLGLIDRVRPIPRMTKIFINLASRGVKVSVIFSVSV